MQVKKRVVSLWVEKLVVQIKEAFEIGPGGKARFLSDSCVAYWSKGQFHDLKVVGSNLPGGKISLLNCFPHVDNSNTYNV